MEAGQGVRLLLRASWQPGPREHHRALVIVHGLGGSDASAYVVATGRLAWARGWHVVRMNMRGSGDGFDLCPLLYNAGLDTDLLAALSALSSLVPRISVAGFSLGANMALLMLGRRREHLPAALDGTEFSAEAAVVDVNGQFRLQLTATTRDATVFQVTAFALWVVARR